MACKTVKISLPRKMSFSTVAHLEILRPPMEVLSNSDLESQLALHTKWTTLIENLP